jgi:hypothetical protein
MRAPLPGVADHLLAMRFGHDSRRCPFPHAGQYTRPSVCSRHDRKDDRMTYDIDTRARATTAHPYTYRGGDRL